MPLSHSVYDLANTHSPSCFPPPYTPTHRRASPEPGTWQSHPLPGTTGWAAEVLRLRSRFRTVIHEPPEGSTMEELPILGEEESMGKVTVDQVLAVAKTLCRSGVLPGWWHSLT